MPAGASDVDESDRALGASGIGGGQHRRPGACSLQTLRCNYCFLGSGQFPAIESSYSARILEATGIGDKQPVRLWPVTGRHQTFA
jgi:hypothetical protein